MDEKDRPLTRVWGSEDQQEAREEAAAESLRKVVRVVATPLQEKVDPPKRGFGWTRLRGTQGRK